MNPIAHIESCFPQKFGIPRQAGIVETPARIVFEPDYRVAEAVRGLEGFDYLWLLWLFNTDQLDHRAGTALDCQPGHQAWSPTVRPPRLGGNERMGVFATRSPFRPNPIGLSSVRLTGVEFSPTLGPVLHVSGADLMDGTPILDIKPYLAYTDSHPDARCGFAPTPADRLLEVSCPEPWLALLPPDHRQPLLDILAHDPRPQYHHDPNRVYGLAFAGFDVRFKVSDGKVEVVAIERSATCGSSY